MRLINNFYVSPAPETKKREEIKGEGREIRRERGGRRDKSKRRRKKREEKEEEKEYRVRIGRSGGIESNRIDQLRFNNFFVYNLIFIALMHHIIKWIN